MINKILLVSPRFYKGRHRLSLLPLAGLGYIAQSLRNAGFMVEVFDMNLQYRDSDFMQHVASFRPDFVGFTLMTFGHKDVYKTIGKIKKKYPHIKTVVGGPHISMLKEKVLEESIDIDYGVILEGDRSIVELCRGADPVNIDGLVYRKDGIVTVNPFSSFITDLDSLPFPTYEGFELKKYPTRQIGIVTSRGCPYDCIYCPVITAIGKQFRQRSAQGVVAEIEYWHRRGYREILILDDNFTLSRKRLEDICSLLAKKNLEGISLKCPNGIRADRVDYTLLKSMRAVGFDMLAFGVEAGTDRVLKNIKKGETIATIEKSIRDACALGFDVDLFFIIGSPGETLDDIEASFSLARRYPIRDAKFYNIIPFPTTVLYEWIKDNGYFLKPIDYILNNASHFINEPCFFTPEMSVIERKKAFRMGQSVSRRIRRRYLEGRLNGELFIKKMLSWIYTAGFFEKNFINNAVFIRAKEKLKNIIKI